MDTPHVEDGDNEGWGSDADLDDGIYIWIHFLKSSYTMVTSFALLKSKAVTVNFDTYNS